MSGSGSSDHRQTGEAARVLILNENESVPHDRRVWDISTTLVASGSEVVVICPQQTPDEPIFEQRDGVEIHRYRPSFAGDGVLGYVREYGRALWCTWRLVRRLAAACHFEVVHACSPPDFLFLASWPARRRGARLIFDHHDLTPELFLSRFGERHRLLYRLTLLLERLSFRAADVVIATNQSYGQVALRRGRKQPPDVFVVPNAPDLSRLKPVAPDPFLKRGKPFLIGYLGVMCRQDGVDLALQSLARLRAKRSDWRAVFAGDGDQLAELVTMTRDLGLEDVVQFMGWIGDKDIARLLSTADICLSPEPKTPFNDASTMVKVVEYMAMSRPIVAFPLEQTRLIAGDAAAYADAGDLASYAARISDLLDDPARRFQMGALGRSRVEASMSWEHSKIELEAAYRRALHHHHDHFELRRSSADVTAPDTPGAAHAVATSTLTAARS